MKNGKWGWVYEIDCDSIKEFETELLILFTVSFLRFLCADDIFLLYLFFHELNYHGENFFGWTC